MGNLQSIAHSERLSPSQRYGSRSAAYSNTQASFNENSSDNTYSIFSGNTTNYHYGGANYDEILRCLYTSSYQEHRRRVREPAEGTCTWFTEHPKYKDWWGKTSGLLWLSADPGCGKSVMASFLVSHLNIRTDAIVCYFFFKDDNEEQKSPTFALCAILHQLFVQRHSLYVYAEEAFKAKGKRFTEEVDTLWNILVRAVSDGGCGEVICVVDALDECEEKTLAPLIHHITRLPASQTSDTHLKFLVTSRPYHRIERDLGSPAMTIRLKGEDEVNAITSDVVRVVDRGIRNLESYWGQHGRLRYLRELLESSADRTFLWVSLVLEILKESEDGSREEFTKIVSTTPRDLAGLYTKILNKSRDPDKARRILHIVVAAARPLTLRELNTAFRVRRDHTAIKDLGDISPIFEKTVKNLCGLFVRVIDSKVYIVHQTAREFLIRTSSWGLGNWQYTLGHKESNFILADICLSYLLLKDFEEDPLAISTPHGGGSAEYASYVSKYTLLDYAASHWADHFRDSQDRQKELFEFTRLICRCGSNRFLTWLGVYWKNSGQYHPFPDDFTHLMTASWFGQGYIATRLLEEGGDINARSTRYGTALNIAALRKDESITRMLLRKNAKACIGGKEYNILLTKQSELERQWMRVQWARMRWVQLEEEESVLQVIAFLKQFCIPDSPLVSAPPSLDTSVLD